jgi:hypothetical protein
VNIVVLVMADDGTTILHQAMYDVASTVAGHSFGEPIIDRQKGLLLDGYDLRPKTRRVKCSTDIVASDASRTVPRTSTASE